MNIEFSTRYTRVLILKITSEVSIMELAPRKQKILSAIIESYIRTGEPVGSKTLLNEAELNVSSATVRNEMADLTGKGYIIQPHTSAGRIPTPLGYRYYIDNMMRSVPLADGGREYIEARLYEAADSPEGILDAASLLLSELTGLVSAATTPSGAESRIRKISFVQTGSHTAMAVVIASNGIIKTKLFRSEFLITPELLQIFDRAMNELFVGVRLSSVNRPFIQTAATKFGELSLFMPAVLMAILDACDKAREISVSLSGQTRMLFSSDTDFLETRNLLNFLNNTHDLAVMLENLPHNTSVSIGSENSRIELQSSSVVSSGYEIDDVSSGVFAVIGPLRMDYPRVISILECVGECVGRMIGELIE